MSGAMLRPDSSTSTPVTTPEFPTLLQVAGAAILVATHEAAKVLAPVRTPDKFPLPGGCFDG